MSLETLALDITQQSSFDASVKNIRKALEGDDDASLQINKQDQRGVVLLSRIPFGFFESEIRKYFRQFGNVTRVRVARSRKTGNSKGFAFIEFKYPEVAKVAAETMDNYLMFNRILKAKYIPPEEQKFDYFRGVVKGKVPRDRHRRIHIEKFNRLLTKAEKKVYCDRSSHNLMRKLKKLQALGIEYECKPVVKFTLKKFNKPVFTIDESDEEITFKIPPNVSIVRKQSSSIGKKKISSKEEKVNKISKDDTSDGDDIIKNKIPCSITPKDENQKIKKKTRSDFQHNDDIKVGVEKIKYEGLGVLESKCGKLNKSVQKGNVCESLAVESTKSTKISKQKFVNAKTVRSVSSVWEVDDCS